MTIDFRNERCNSETGKRDGCHIVISAPLCHLTTGPVDPRVATCVVEHCCSIYSHLDTVARYIPISLENFITPVAETKVRHSDILPLITGTGICRLHCIKSRGTAGKLRSQHEVFDVLFQSEQSYPDITHLRGMTLLLAAATSRTLPRLDAATATHELDQRNGTNMTTAAGTCHIRDPLTQAQNTRLL